MYSGWGRVAGIGIGDRDSDCDSGFSGLFPLTSLEGINRVEWNGMGEVCICT